MREATSYIDAEAIHAVLAAGTIGEMPFPAWLEQMGAVLSLNEPRYIGRPVPRSLAELCVAGVRWEPGDTTNPDPQRLWQSFLVTTLPTEPPYSLKLIHDIAVEACGSCYYSLRGNELWIEYLVARPDVRDEIERALVEGKIGELPFPMWFRYYPASTSIENMADVLAALGVTAVRWEKDEYENRLGRQWQAYLVATLPVSSSVSPPSLPSERLVSQIGMTLRMPNHVTTDVTDTAVEVWVSYSMKLPLGDPPGVLIERDGITYVSYSPDDMPARKNRLRQALKQIFRSTQARS